MLENMEANISTGLNQKGKGLELTSEKWAFYWHW